MIGLASLCALSTLVQAGSPPVSQPGVTERANRAWAGYLDRYFGSDARLVVIDLPRDAKPRPLGVSRGTESAELKILGAVLDREARDVSGATVLLRRIEDPTGRGAEPWASLADWIPAASAEERKALFSQAGLPYRKISPKGREALATMAAQSVGLGEAVLGGGAIQVSAEIDPQIEYRDEEGVRRTVPVRRYAKCPTPAPEETSSPDGASNDGPAEAPQRAIPGKLTTLGELADRVVAENGVYIRVDERLRATPIYLRGEVKGSQLNAVVLELARIPEPSLQPYRRTDRLVMLQDPLADLLADARRAGLGAYLDGKEEAAEDLSAKDPQIAAALRAAGVSPGAKVRLTYGVLVKMAAPGFSPSLFGGGADARSPNREAFLIVR